MSSFDQLTEALGISNRDAVLELKACRENQKILIKLANRQKITLMYNVILVLCVLVLIIVK